MPRTLVQALAFVIGMWLAIELVQPIGIGWMALPRLGPVERETSVPQPQASPTYRDPFSRSQATPQPLRGSDDRKRAADPAASGAFRQQRTPARG